MLGEILGRRAGLGCDELLRFFLPPFAGTLKSAPFAVAPLFGDVAEPTAGLGGMECAPVVVAVPFVIGRAEPVGVGSCDEPETCVFSGCSLGVLSVVETAGSGRARSAIGCMDPSQRKAAGSVLDFAMFMSTAGVTGAVLAARGVCP